MFRRAVTLVFALVAVPLLVAPAAQSAPACRAGYQCERAYYADNTYDDRVGGYARFCDGSSTSWGTMTPYQQTTQVRCPQR